MPARRPRTSRWLPSVVATLAILGACTDDEPTAEGTTTAPTSDGSGTSTPEDPELSDLVLRGDGLGVVDLGDPPDAAVAGVAAVLGEPTLDTGWQPAASTYGTCPGPRIRGVEWDHLVLLFTDGETRYGDGEHLFSWRVTGAPPAVGTASGFGFHASAADASELYPGQVEAFPAEEPFPAVLEVQIEGGLLTAYLDETDIVTNLEAGATCGE